MRRAEALAKAPEQQFRSGSVPNVPGHWVARASNRNRGRDRQRHGHGTGTAPAWEGGVVPLPRSGSGAGHPAADSIRPVQDDPSARPEDLQKELVQTDPQPAAELAAAAGKFGGQSYQRAGGYPAADEGSRAHGDPFRLGTLFEG